MTKLWPFLHSRCQGYTEYFDLPSLRAETPHTPSAHAEWPPNTLTSQPPTLTKEFTVQKQKTKKRRAAPQQ